MWRRICGAALRITSRRCCADAAMVRRLSDYYDARYGLDAKLLSVPEAALPREPFETVACL